MQPHGRDRSTATSGAETEPGDWWLPTVAERKARAAKLAEQRTIADAQRALGPTS